MDEEGNAIFFFLVPDSHMIATYILGVAPSQDSSDHQD